VQTVTPIGQLKPGRVTVRGRISGIRSYTSKKGYLVTRATVTDDSGKVACMWFNNNHIATLNPYTIYEFTGTYKESYGKFGLFQSTVRKAWSEEHAIAQSFRPATTPSYTPQKQTKSSSGWGWLVGLAVAGFVIFGGNSSTTTPSSSGSQSTTPASSITSQEDSAPTSSDESPTPKVTAPSNDNLSNDNSYINTYGNEVHSPAYSTDNSVPAGASARCADGTYSFSQSRRGTCSHHGGVSEWL
jgi:hypothetical protein